MARKLRKAHGMRERTPNVWEVIAQAGKDPITGKYRQITRRAYGGITEAKKVRAKLLAEIAQDQHAGTDSTVDQLYTEWLKELERLDRSPRTIKEYKRIYNRDIQTTLGHIPISKVTTKLLTELYADLQINGSSVYMVRKIHATISSMMSQACRWGWRTNNPAEWAQLPPLPEPEPISPTPTEVQKLIRDASNSKRPVYASLIFLAATTGARRGELCALRLSAIDWEQQTLRIARNIAVVDDQLINRPTKNRRRRTISLDNRALELLQAHVDQMEGPRLWYQAVLEDF